MRLFWEVMLYLMTAVVAMYMVVEYLRVVP